MRNKGNHAFRFTVKNIRRCALFPLTLADQQKEKLQPVPLKEQCQRKKRSKN